MARRSPSNFTAVSTRELSANRVLRDKGLVPVRWAGTLNRLRELGIPITEAKDTFVQTHSPKKGMLPTSANRHGRQTGEVDHWAPAWAVLVCEVEPLPEGAREQYLVRALKDPELQQAIDTIMRLTPAGEGMLLKKRVADFVLEQWEPGA